MTSMPDELITSASSAFFAGTEVLPPGVVQLHQWHPGEPARPAAGEVPAYAGLGRKP
jgi:hypothetical protein